MKRIPLITLLLIGAMGTCAFAQSLSFGVRAGVGYAAASTGSEVTLSPRPSAIVGGSVELEILPPLVFQAGIQYAQKRTTVSHDTPGLPKPTEGEYSLNYFEIPITLKLGFGSRAFHVYGLAGANVGTLLKAVRDSPLPGGTDSDIKASLDRTSVGLELGGGVGFQVAPRVSFVVDGRYNLGLKDINRSGTAMVDTGAWKPRDLRITAGLIYRIGR
jgi:opacity protein-like surface antigen